MTLHNLRNRFVTCLGVAALLAPALRAADTADKKATTLVAVALQDEPRKLPKDITAMLTRADRRVRFELVKLSGADAQSLAGTPITVIEPNGELKNITADETGVAVLENATPGLNAVVIGGRQGHGAFPLAVREAPADAPETGQLATLRLPLVGVQPREVINFARSARVPETEVGYSDIDTEFVSTATAGDAFGYRFRLDSQGALHGQVLSLVRSGISAADVEGTNVMIYSDSNLVGQAVADQQGFFLIPSLAPGVYGLVAVGPAGYAAFAFETYSAQTIARSRVNAGATLVSTTAPATDGDLMPVVLIPTPMVGQLVYALEQSYGPLLGGIDAGLAGPELGALPAGLPIGFGGGPSSGGFGGGSAGAVSGAGGLGGLGALGAIGAIGAVAAANSDDDDSNNDPGDNASPSEFRIMIVPDSDSESEFGIVILPDSESE